ncbi:GTP-binding protein [Candidatus Thorarchaeota archaeon]|nr:MAG: GTP-binding protein [Candidatus Thorarchaeota archaeon]
MKGNIRDTHGRNTLKKSECGHKKCTTWTRSPIPACKMLIVGRHHIYCANVIEQGGFKLSNTAYVYKVCVVGDQAVGKTSTIIRWIQGYFRDDYISTMGVQHYSTSMKIDEDTKLKIIVWDLAGQDTFKQLRGTFYGGAAGVLVMFDVTKRETFKSIPGWVQEATKHIGRRVPFIIVGNKSDLVTENSDYFGVEEYAESMNAPFLITSAKTGDNITNLFHLIGEIVHKKAMESRSDRHKVL